MKNMNRIALLPILLLLMFVFISFQKDTPYAYEKDLLSPDFHKGRRDALRALMPANSVAVFFSNRLHIRSNDVEFDFHQDPDFYYLTGHMEPNSALVIFKEEQVIDSLRTNEMIFIPERDASQELWTGRILGVEEGSSSLGIQTVLSDSLFLRMNFNWKKFSQVYYRPFVYSLNEEQQISDMTDRMNAGFNEKVGLLTTANKTKLDLMMMKLRKVKTPEEMVVLRKAITISNEAHIEFMKALKPDMTEYQAQAIMEYGFKILGAEYEGYPSICGSAETSCILHYTSNRRTFCKKDLVLMDCGAEYHGYSADITRTMPVNGKFSPEQKIIYELVLKAQLAGINKCKAGNDFHDPNRATIAIITQGLLDLGIIKKEEEYRKYYPHGCSHHIGLDVHDADYEGILEANNVITVEPGIYIPEGSPCDPKWWNIGVRIEDDVLITTGEPEVLSGAVPKTVAEIEATMAMESYLNTK